MNPEHASSRARSPRLALLMALLLVPLLTGGASARQADVGRAAGFGQQNQALDLPAMALRPDDIADAGVEGFGASFSVLADDADEIEEYIAYSNIDPASDDAAAFAEADAERYYVLDLDNAVPDAEGEWTYYTKVVETLVLQYDDEDDAAAGLAAMEAVWGDSDSLSSSNLSADFGDNAVYFEGTGIDNYTSQPTERALLLFQRDTIVAGLLIYDSDADNTFDQDRTEELGRVLQDRVDAGLAGNTPGLGTNVVRLDVPALNSWNDHYMTIDGTILCTSNTTAKGDCDLFQETVDDFNEVSRYYLYHRIAGDVDLGEPESYIQLSLRTFEDEESAALRFAEMSGEFPDGAPDLEHLDIGDESIRWSRENEDFRFEELIVRAGNVVLEVRHSTAYALAEELGWTFDPSPAALQEIAELQVACIEGDASCAEPVAIPDGMLPDEALTGTAQAGTSDMTAFVRVRTLA